MWWDFQKNVPGTKIFSNDLPLESAWMQVLTASSGASLGFLLAQGYYFYDPYCFCQLVQGRREGQSNAIKLRLPIEFIENIKINRTIEFRLLDSIEYQSKLKKMQRFDWRLIDCIRIRLPIECKWKPNERPCLCPRQFRVYYNYPR